MAAKRRLAVEEFVVQRSRLIFVAGLLAVLLPVLLPARAAAQVRAYAFISNFDDNAVSDRESASEDGLRTDGSTLIKEVGVPAEGRVTVGVIGEGSAVPELMDESFGTLIESTRPVIVERSLYSNAGGVVWAAGTNARAMALPEPQ